MTPRAWKRLFARIVLWAGIILASTLFVLLAGTTWHVYTKERDAKQARLNEEQALQELQSRQASLTTQINDLDTPRGTEEVIRDRYPVAKAGEEVIVLTDNPNAAQNANAGQARSLWDRLVSWFSW